MGEEGKPAAWKSPSSGLLCSVSMILVKNQRSRLVGRGSFKGDVIGTERFGSRLGFILISAGCAIAGLGNVWRFPTSPASMEAAFLVMYPVFLVILGLPSWSWGGSPWARGSQRSIARAFNVLEPAGTHWHKYKWVGIAGCYLLMMFYTTVAGWMLAYVPKFASGQFVGADSQATTGRLRRDAGLAGGMRLLDGSGVRLHSHLLAGGCKRAWSASPRP